MRGRAVAVAVVCVYGILTSALVWAQAGAAPTGHRGPYLGQTPPGLTPTVFAPGMVSTPTAWEAAISFTPDGSEVFFTRRLVISGNENRILHMTLKNGEWTAPGPPSFARDLTEYEAFVSPDGRTIFYNSDRPKPARPGAVGEIWYSEKTADGWGEGQYLSDTINKGWVMFVTAARNGTLYFTAGYDRRFGVYRSVLEDGQYQEPEFLPDEINHLRGAHPFIAPDESYLIFDAQPDGMGKSRLFVSFRTGTGGWTRARPFDSTINATDTENIPYVSPDGKYFFFHRTNDIYWVDAAVIARLR